MKRSLMAWVASYQKKDRQVMKLTWEKRPILLQCHTKTLVCINEVFHDKNIRVKRRPILLQCYTKGRSILFQCHTKRRIILLSVWQWLRQSGTLLCDTDHIEMTHCQPGDSTIQYGACDVQLRSATKNWMSDRLYLRMMGSLSMVVS